MNVEQNVFQYKIYSIKIENMCFYVPAGTASFAGQLLAPAKIFYAVALFRPCFVISSIFTELAPQGRFSQRVSMSVSLWFCLRHFSNFC